jgi:anti-anti-sigma factor
MEITRTRTGVNLELVLKGRLDGLWASQLDTELEEWIRKGERHIRMDMAQVSFMSSAGIRILVKTYKALKRLKGSLLITRPSEFVAELIEVSGLQELCAPGGESPAEEEPEIGSRSDQTWEDMSVSIHHVAPGKRLRCRTVGNPQLLHSMNYSIREMHSLSLPPGVFGVGMGAFGRNFEDCRQRFGEFIVAGGAAAYLPADGSNTPDFLLSRGDYIPQVQVLYAILCDGEPSHLIRFQPTGVEGIITLSSLVRLAFQVTGAQSVGMVIMAESAGLVGASLKQSPATDEREKQAFQFPEIRKWVSFASERLYRKSLALVAGIALAEPVPHLEQLVRPLGTPPMPAGHFHAASFSYRALHGEEINLEPMVSSLFEGETLQGILHLISDRRDLQGAGESEFVRGTLWVGPIERSLYL